MHPRAAMFQNRLRKNLRRLRPWAAQHGIEAYRLYDRDIPEIGLLCDHYAGRILLSEYARPAGYEENNPGDNDAFLRDAQAVLSAECGVATDAVYVKRRERQHGSAQYQKFDEARHEFLIQEGGHRFWVNLSDYLDTGLFLDHRDTRALVQQMSAGRRVLNLFGYTGSFSVYAAAGGAHSSVTIDLSSTYLAWAARNFAANGLDPARHLCVRADVLEFLRAPSRYPEAAGRYDLIVLDPPSFSNSKKMRGTLDIQRDHVAILRQALAFLNPGGALLFSCNLRRFTLHAQEVLQDFQNLGVRDLSEQTLPNDFRRPPARCCFLFTSS